uniref:Uncharacterized protein n=1 Tax=Nelumbo nucifera TaxID=4432 RepID=A0A822YFJ5_NELNU|nr:TPA_asm: hypothetical protein HUJ06_010161 [Nelumbo nucifera]
MGVCQLLRISVDISTWNKAIHNKFLRNFIPCPLLRQRLTSCLLKSQAQYSFAVLTLLLRPELCLMAGAIYSLSLLTFCKVDIVSLLNHMEGDGNSANFRLSEKLESFSASRQAMELSFDNGISKIHKVGVSGHNTC